MRPQPLLVRAARWTRELGSAAGLHPCSTSSHWNTLNQAVWGDWWGNGKGSCLLLNVNTPVLRRRGAAGSCCCFPACHIYVSWFLKIVGFLVEFNSLQKKIGKAFLRIYKAAFLRNSVACFSMCYTTDVWSWSVSCVAFCGTLICDFERQAVQRGTELLRWIKFSQC